MVMVLLAGSAAFAATSFPNDYFFAVGDQWALTGATASINVPPAWCASTGAGITVGDVDTGANFDHPDLAGKLVPGAAFLNGNGAQSGSGQAAVQDDNGHGSMTTGIMVADTNNNGRGIAAVAPDAKALIIKVLGSNGSGNSSDVSAGIHYAVDNGAKVINLSIGSDVPMAGGVSGIPSAVDYAAQQGVAMALAAGNNMLPVTDYVRIANKALVVGALNPDGSVAYYSTNGAGVNIFAPGGDDSGGSDVKHLIVSTWWTGSDSNVYGIGEGTSFAAPQVAGVLALLMAKGYSAAGARSQILSTAVMRNGVPELDASRALGSTSDCGTPGPSPTATQNVTTVTTVHSSPASTSPRPTSGATNPGSGSSPPVKAPSPSGQSPAAQAAAAQSPTPGSIIAISPDGPAPESKAGKHSLLPITLAVIGALVVAGFLLAARLREPFQAG